jgi:hypothetical protein
MIRSMRSLGRVLLVLSPWLLVIAYGALIMSR